MKRKNPARAGRSEYRSREVRETRGGEPYYTVKNEWLDYPPTLTEGHLDLPEVREAAVIAEHAREHGAPLGRGNFGQTFLTQTANGPITVKVAAQEALYGNRQRWTRADQQRNMMHEAGVANELAEMGYDVVPRTIYVELADGTPALVREYGDLADTLTPDEFYALETRLLALEQETGWRVQDDLLALRRPDGSLFIGDVGIWQPPTVRQGTKSTYSTMDSSLGALLTNLAASSLGKDITSLPRIVQLTEALADKDEDHFFVKDFREDLREALTERESVGVPSPPSAYRAAEGRQYVEHPAAPDDVVYRYAGTNKVAASLHAAADQIAQNKVSTKKKLEAMKWGARWLYADDPESFVGGCGDIALTLEMFAKELGFSGVKAVSGIAHVREPVMHAWIEVDGKLYDARADVEKIRYRKHRKDQDNVDMFCDSLFVWDEDFIRKMASEFKEGKPAPVVELVTEEDW